MRNATAPVGRAVRRRVPHRSRRVHIDDRPKPARSRRSVHRRNGIGCRSSLRRNGDSVPLAMKRGSRHQGCREWRAVVKGRSLAGIDLQGADLRKAKLLHCRLSGLDLTTTTLDGADLGGSALAGSHLENNRHLAGLILDRANLEARPFAGHNWIAPRREARPFATAKLTGASLVEADLRRTDWTGARLHAPADKGGPPRGRSSRH